MRTRESDSADFPSAGFAKSFGATDIAWQSA
jgi:hypothetical protein